MERCGHQAELVVVEGEHLGSVGVLGPTRMNYPQALATVDGAVDYINAHGTSTPAGDIQELKAVREAFAGRDHIPVIGSTKSLSGHSLGAAGVQEAVYSLLMQQAGFIAASANIEDLDPEAAGLPIAVERHDDADLQRVMSNSFGFGGTNASLVFQKYDG